MDTNCTNREIRRSLETICATMDAFKDETGDYESCIEKCREVLVDKGNVNARWFNSEFIM